jgi:hypothetical protein
MAQKKAIRAEGAPRQGDRAPDVAHALFPGHCPNSAQVRSWPMFDDPRSRFYYCYEKYFVARLHSQEEKEIRFYALLSLAQVHQIVGDSDQAKAAKVMHELMGMVLSETQAAEMYQELRKDSGVVESPTGGRPAQRVGFS